LMRMVSSVIPLIASERLTHHASDAFPIAAMRPARLDGHQTSTTRRWGARPTSGRNQVSMAWVLNSVCRLRRSNSRQRSLFASLGTGSGPA
jgi:hypothetical protein